MQEEKIKKGRKTRLTQLSNGFGHGFYDLGVASGYSGDRVSFNRGFEIPFHILTASFGYQFIFLVIVLVFPPLHVHLLQKLSLLHYHPTAFSRWRFW